MRQTGYYPRPLTSMQAPEILLAGSFLQGAIYIFFNFMKIGRGFSELWGSKIAISHWPVAYTTACCATVQASE